MDSKTKQILNSPGRKIIIDTCVMLDMMIEDRPRFNGTQSLYDYLASNKVLFFLPVISMFEISAGVQNIKMNYGKKLTFNSRATDSPLYFRLIDIDEEFFLEYKNDSLPYMKAADLIFLSIAHKHDMVLISYDNNLLTKSKSCGVTALTPQDFMTSMQ